MRLTAIIILSACLTASAKTGAQGITLSVKNASLEKVFTEIKKQTGYSFVYNNSLVSGTKKISIAVNRATIEEVLQLALEDQPLSYEIIDKTIIIKPKSITPSTSVAIASAATIDIRGRVTNEAGEPVVASVMVKGTQTGTTTNADGYFELKGVDENATLVISGVSIETREIKVGGKSDLAITAVTKITSMNEVVINKGYYTEKQKLSVSNVAKVTAKEIERQPVDNPLLALQGRVPGLFITQSNGLPGSSVRVRIQGQNSISKGNDPLYIIDGVPFTSQLLEGVGVAVGTSNVVNNIPSYGSPFNFLNPSDIESIEVLKDADATAIYGSRAANGAILITTKKGRVGKLKMDLNIQSGFGKVNKKVNVLNNREFLMMRREALANDGSSISQYDYDLNGAWDSTRSIDWQDELIGGTAKYTDLQLSFSGGNSNTQYMIGGGYHNETTVFPGDFSNRKASLQFNLNTSSNNKRFQLQMTGNYLNNLNRLMYGDVDVTLYAIRRAPMAPALFNADGSLNWAVDANGTSTVDNPLAYLYKKNINKGNNLVSNASLSYHLFDSLIIKSSFGYTNLQIDELSTFPSIAIAPENRANNQRGALYADNSINSWVIEPQLSYKKTFSLGSFDFLIGSTFYKKNSNGQILNGNGYISDLVLEDIKSAGAVSVGRTHSSEYRYNALFGRINYNWKEKYLINLTGRRDGSSRFGKENQLHNFGAIGLGWIFTNERAFIESASFLNFGKLRISYGTTGNDQIGDYEYLNLYNPTSVNLPYQSTRGLTVNRLQNPFLQWEKTKKLQLGLDLALFRDRINISSTFFQNRSSNQLIRYNLPITTGFSSIIKNFPATVENSGFELAINSQNLSNGKLKWTSSFNITIPRNKLISFQNIESSPYFSDYVIGEPITIVRAYRFAGVNSATGIYEFYDKNGSLTSNPDISTDFTAIINTAPEFYGGLQNSIALSDFQLDFLFQFVKQIGRNDLHFGTYPGGNTYYGTTNQPTTVLNRWQKPGDNTTIQKFDSDYSNSRQFDNAQISDAAFENASYIRLKNVSLSWQIPSKLRERMALSNARIYVNAQNLATFTKYKGLDPETLSSTTLPTLKVLTFGIQLTF